jgi:hypothetical protein
MPTHLIVAAATLALLAIAGPSLAREREDERGHDREHDRGPDRRAARPPGPTPPAEARYRKECGSCHLAYPPGLLPAASWQRILAGLERHFGQNAELDAETSATLERFLTDNAAEAGTDRASPEVLAPLTDPAPLRPSELPSLRRKHRNIAPQVLARPAVRSLANCAACHPGASRWDFEDDDARIPPAGR